MVPKLEMDVHLVETRGVVVHAATFLNFFCSAFCVALPYKNEGSPGSGLFKIAMISEAACRR